MKTAYVVGKGITARYLTYNNKDIFVAINQAVIFIDEVDYVFANDYNGLDGIPPERMPHIKHVAIPEYPHFDGVPAATKTYKLVMERFKDYPHLKYVPYNLHTWKTPNPELPTPEIAMTSAGMAIGYFLKYHDVKHFELYGIGNGMGYHPKIVELLPANLKKFSKGWQLPARLGDLANSIRKACKKYNATVNFN